MDNKKILVAVPAYNCASQISNVISQFVKAPKNLFYELLIIDNCSDDETCKIVAEEIKRQTNFRISIILNYENYGLGGTHKVAFNYCNDHNFDGVVILHGDDQADLKDFFPILLHYVNRTDDAILGSRFMQGSRLEGYSLFRIIGNYIFNALYSLGARTIISDMGSGLNFYDRKLTSDPLHFNMPDDLTFHGAYLLALIATNKRIRYVPISWREKDQISNAKFFIQSLKLIKYLIIFILNKTKLLSMDHRDNKRKNYFFKVVDSTFKF
jgi:glycosyltransferase involved in cell wall biosynthesis